MQKLVVSLFAVVASLALAGAAAAAPRTARATLTGEQEVPPVETNANGTFFVSFDPGLTEARFDLRVRNGVQVTQAHLHCAPAGVNGPVVVFLFGPADPPVDVHGRLASGTLRNEDMIPTEGEPCGRVLNSIASLYAAMLEGLVYANVHTTDHPAGEVRAQLFP